MNEIKTMAVTDESLELQPLNVMGDTYYTTYTRKYRNRQKWEKPDDKQVLSFIPGTVREVLVQDGQEVKHGQKIMVLEAMKMMNSIYSPADGLLEKVHVNVGDRIPKGTVLITFA